MNQPASLYLLTVFELVREDIRKEIGTSFSDSFTRKNVSDER